MEACNHEFLPVMTGWVHGDHENRCIRCGKTRDEIMRHSFMNRVFADIMNEPQHVAFVGHELESK